MDLQELESKTYSQNGEDGIIAEIFKRIGTTNKFFVEFGVEDGSQCNTRLLREQGWQGLWMDSVHDNDPIKKELVTAENINELFKKHNVPSEFDLLSIDIDSNDYWVWKAIEGYKARVVVIEYNASVPPTEAKTIAYDTNFRWQGDDYFGASLKALNNIAEEKGYKLIYCEKLGVNAFFVQKEFAQLFENKSLEEIYRAPAYGPDGKGHPASGKEMQSV